MKIMELYIVQLKDVNEKIFLAIFCTTERIQIVVWNPRLIETFYDPFDSVFRGRFTRRTLVGH